MTAASEPPAAVAPSQVRHPWRAVERTVLQLIVGGAAGLPIIISASGVPQTAAGIGTALAISAVITRLMAMPAVDAALQVWAPWLATEPGAAPPGQEPA